MDTRTITVDEVVRNTIRILREIRLPAEMSSAIGVPIEQAIRNLNLCVDAWEREAREAQIRAEEEARRAREEMPEPGMEPLVIMARDAGCPEEEAEHAD